MAAAKRRLTEALKVAQDVGFDDEEIELMTDSLAQIRAVLNLIDMRIAGKTDVDWDADPLHFGDRFHVLAAQERVAEVTLYPCGYLLKETGQTVDV